MSPLRRKILQAGGLLALGMAGYTFNRGLRLPTLHWDPLPHDTDIIVSGLGRLQLNDFIVTSAVSEQSTALRAFAPEPGFVLTTTDSGPKELTISNIAEDAELIVKPESVKVDEQIDGIRRNLTITAPIPGDIELTWKLPELGSYTFAAIGDTGGDRELAWCLQRAHQLGARFLLHLGDFNYQPGDYERSIRLFNQSPIPVYVSIGNHDFHDSGGIYQPFLREIGPLNNAFVIGKTRYINLDTATSILPYSAGQRGDIIEQQFKLSEFTDTVVFTHRPLHDPQEGSDHDIGNRGERDWLIHALKKLKAPTLLSGHIHIFDRREFAGIDNIIAGQGLGHQDLLVNRDYSWMVIGQVDSDGKVSYDRAPLAMPMELHCHPRTDPVKQSLAEAPHRDVIERINQACQKP